MANNRKKHANEQVENSFKNVDSSSAYATMRKVSLSTLATVLTAATCLGGQPILASSNILLPPTTAAFAQEVRKNDPTPWLHRPNILEFQRYRFANSNGTTGSTANLGDYDNTTKKSDMYAHLEKNGSEQYLVFDVFFNNDGKSMLKHSSQHQYVWQIPFTVADLNSDGGYKNDTISELSFDFYQRNGLSPQATNAMLSRDIKLFNKNDKKSFNVNFLNNGKDHEGSTYLYTLGIRGGSSYNRDLNETFHNNARSNNGKLDPVIEKAIKLYGPYSGKSYGIGLRTTNANYAVHMHCKLKLRQNATIDDIQNAFTWANSSSFGKTTNSAYTFISGRTHDENFPRTKSDSIAPKLYLNGKEIGDKDNNSIDVYQGETPNITFGTSDNSEKVTKFSVNGFPDSIKANFKEDKADGFDATEKNPYNHVVENVKFEHKDGKTPVNSDYTITVSATDASGNTTEKKVTVHLKNLNQKYPSPTADALTVDWGHELNKDELTKQIKNNAGNGTITFGKKLPNTKLSESAFKRSKNKLKVTAKITYADGSSHTVDIPVIVKKPLAFEHLPKGSNNTVTVGDELKQPGAYITLENNSDNKVQPKKVEWYGGTPNSSTIGRFDKTVRVNYTDGSRKDTTVTFNVKPQKPVIETDLNGRAKIQNQKVVVNVGTGFIPGATNKVTLYDANNNEIGSTTEIKDGKATITVANGIPAGNVYAVTNSSYNNTQDKHIKIFNLSSDKSENHQATEDKQAPTLTANDATAKVGENLSFNLEAKDDIKIDDFNIAAPLAQLVNGDFSRLKIEYQETKDNSKHRKVKITILGMKANEVGEHKLKFSVTDAAGNTTEKEVKLTVKQPYELKKNPITVDLGHELTNDDAKKIFENSKNVPSGTTYTWVNKPETDSTGNEKKGTVKVSIPGGETKDITVAVTVQDKVKPVIKVYKKGPNNTWVEVADKITEGNTSYTKIDTYHGDKNDIKITATDDSGNVTTLTLTPKTPGEKEKDPTGTGTTDNPKTLMLDGTTPLNTQPGKYKRTITAVDPSGNTTTVAVEFVVKTQAEKYSKVTGTPVTYKMSSGTTHPDPKSGINAADLNKLPKDAKYSWATEPDWNTPGKDTTAEVLITFPDGSTEKVETKVTVKDDIAPVINTPNTNKAKKADTDKTPEYYQFKVHNGEHFSIDINAYDNSGKIKMAEFDSALTTAIPDSKISITNNDKNSAEKPAKITITGTAQRDPKITNSSDNKWSRDLVVTDEAGNKSTIKVQISIYTDAEEHTATAKQVDKNNGDSITEQDITNAITITNKDPKIKPTFTVTKPLPKNTATGMHTVPVTVKYPDGSTTVVDVPVKIGSAAKAYDPQGNTITVPWHSTEDLATKIKLFGKGKGLKWNGNKQPANDPTVTIVGNSSVPSTDKPGESKVQVNVKYSDGSSDVATVTVKVLDPQNKDYTPEGKTINIAYNKTPNTSIKNNVETNGVKLKKNGETTYLTNLPDGASIAVDDNNTVPDGTQPGDFNIPVTITYADGSKDHATVKVTVGKPQSETNTPTTSEIQVGYNGTAPTPDEIIKKVTVPDKPKDTKITVDDNQTINTKTPGTVNVKVTVKYPDGSEDHVEVPVTVGDPDNETYKPSAEEVKKNRRDKITAADITGAVKTSTVDGKPAPTETKVELANPKTPLPTTDKTGTTNVPVKVTYPDGSEVVLEVPVVVRDTDKDIYTPTSSTLEKSYGSTISEDEIIGKVKVPNFVGDKTKISYKVKDAKKIPGEKSEPGAYTVPVTVTYPDNTSEDVDVNVTILNKDSDSYEPTATTLTKKHGETISNDDITGQVSVPNYPTGKKQPDKTVVSGKKLPDTNTPGESDVPVTVTYPDGTSDTVNVHVVVKDTDANTHTPQAEPLEKAVDSGKPSDDEITSKVKIPNWPKGGTQPTYSIADSDKDKIPTGDKAGKFEVPVTVKYPDKSTTVINVPVIINAPTAKPQDVTVPKGVEPKPEDMISNKDKFPEGTTFEWKKENGNETGKPDTNTAGNKQGTVVVTVPGQNSQEATAKVNVVDPTASEVNVLQGKDLPEAEDVIKDSDNTNNYPDGTDFKWKPEDKPDTDNPGAKNGVIIVTLPGQKPKEVPVTVNVLPKPEANVVNVPQNGTLPDAKNVIKDSDNKSKFPNGTDFKWKDNGPSTTDSGTQTGTITVTVPGVNGKTGTSSDVEVTVNVTPAPKEKDTSVIQHSDPDPKNSIENNGSFPEGTTFTWGRDENNKSKKPDTSKTGKQTGTVVVTVPGQEPQTVEVNVNVTPAPEGKNITVLQKKDGDTTDTTPQPTDVIKNHKDLPNDANISWTKKPDTSKTGNQPGIVTVTVPGMTPVDVPVNVLVVPNPVGKKVNVPVNAKPKPEDSIANKDELPKGTTFTWAAGENGTPDTSSEGQKSGTVVVTIPGIAPVNVTVKVNVVAQNTPFINDRKAENKPGNNGSTDNSKTTITGKGTPEATIKVQDSNGTPLKDGGKDITVTVNNDGSFTVDIPHQKPGTELKLVPSKGGVDGDETTVTVTAKPQKPKIEVTNRDGKNDGNVTVTPPDGDATVVKIEINAKPNPINGPEQPVRTIVVKKDDKGTWQIDGDHPDGVGVDPKTGVVTIPAMNLEDGSTITAVAKNDKDKPSDPATAVTGFKTPQITKQTLKDNPDDSTKQIITGKTLPGAKVTVTGTDGKQIDNPVTADKDGNFTITINKQKPGTIITLTPTNGKGDGKKTGDSVDLTVGGAIATPNISTPTDGGASVTPDESDTRVNKVVITYTPEGSTETSTITVVAEGDKHEWKIDGSAPNGVTVDPQTGVVTIPADKIKHGSTITAQSEDSSDKTGKSKSGEVTAKVGEKKKPTPTPTPTPTPEPEPEPGPIPTDRPLVVTPQNGEDQGSATVTPPAGADSVEITYIPEGEETFSGVGETGIPSIEELVPETTNPDSQEPGNTTGNTPGNATPGDNTTGNETDGNGTAGNKTPRVTIKIKKDADGKWTFDGKVPDGVTVDPQTGVVTIPANKVKDNTEVTAKSKKGEETSSDATGTTGTDPNNKHGEEPDHPQSQWPDLLPTPDSTIWDIPGVSGVPGVPGVIGNGRFPYEAIENNGGYHGDDSGNGNQQNQGNLSKQDDQGNGNAQSGTQAESKSGASAGNNAGAATGAAGGNAGAANGANGANGAKRPAQHSSGKIAQYKLSKTGATVAAIGAIAAIAAAAGAAITVIVRKKKRK